MDPHGAGVFDPWGEPNVDCPQCGGLGEGAAFVKDSRYLSPAGRALLANVRPTPNGPEVVMHDRIKALVHLGRHLGMFTPKKAQDGQLTRDQIIDLIR